jgi:Ca2+-transporting ATPase
MIETGIALAVAAIPEGLPIVATVALARGLWRMARRNAVVNRLSAVETLGATRVIMTDKTGTLTENQMTATHILLNGETIEITGEGLDTEGEFRRDGQTMDPAQNALLRRALEVGVLCNDASLRQGDDDKKTSSLGDPSEVALLVAGAKAGLERKQLVGKTPEVREVAFDPDVKMMATVHESDGNYRLAVKGAPSAVLEASSTTWTGEGRHSISDEERQQWLERNSQLAAEGLRVFGLASKTAKREDVEVYEDLDFLGLIALLDPPRADVQPSIESCQEAGIEVVMVTGDQPSTAVTVAKAVGLVGSESQEEAVLGQRLKSPEELSKQERKKLLGSHIFARVSPKQKLDLITVHQDAGSVVAMTGDGVNDAPALKKADIGIAMGQRGTQVAREAADMVLKDDAFSSIVLAVEQGRVIFNNIRNFVLYLLSCNVAEIMVVSAASLINAPLPIRPLQILFLNLVTDVFPALALGVSEGDPAIMKQPPRDPQEPILVRHHWVSVAGYGLAITLSVLGSLALALNWLSLEREEAVTVSFLTLAFAQLWHVFNMRAPGSGFLRNDVTENRFVWGALALCTVLLLAGVYLPGLSDVLRTSSPGARGWAIITCMSLLPWAGGQVVKEIRGRQL